MQSELHELICTAGQLDDVHRVSGTVRGCGLRSATVSPMRVEDVELDAVPSEHGTPPTKGKRELDRGARRGADARASPEARRPSRPAAGTSS